MIFNPQLLFLDEPTAGIDPILRRKFWDYFKELQEEGHTLFVTTQYVGEAAYCDLVGVMHEGKLLMTETPSGLRKQAYGGDVIAIKTTEGVRLEQRHQLESLPFVNGKVQIVSDQEVDVIVDDASTAIPALLEWAQDQKLNVETIEQKFLPFDDVFVKIIERETAHV